MDLASETTLQIAIWLSEKKVETAQGFSRIKTLIDWMDTECSIIGSDTASTNVDKGNESETV